MLDRALDEIICQARGELGGLSRIAAVTGEAGRFLVIARQWSGRARPERAGGSEEFVSRHTLPEIAARQADGYHGAYLLRRDDGAEVEFATILIFESIDAVKVFGGGGDDYDTAYVLAGGRALPDRFDQKAAHYEILASAEQTR